MITGFCLVPSDNLPPKTPIPIQLSAGIPHPSLLSCFYLGWYPMLSLFCDLHALHLHHKTKPSQLPLIQSHIHLLRVKFPLCIYIGDTSTQQAFQSFSKASISKLCCSTSYPGSWVLMLPLNVKEPATLEMLYFLPALLLLELSSVAAALPSPVFLVNVIQHTKSALVFPSSNKNFEILYLLTCIISIFLVFNNSDFFQITLFLIHSKLLVCPSSSRNHLAHFIEQQYYLWTTSWPLIFCSHLSHIFHHPVY